ncbi:hypothetical protein [Acidihalobacter aeolianus]|uniref:hypothetical protein n=1 Tax=Acidihalobacter aeolianus TaxID=2792603 RepID=UPI0012EA33FD|nr:hypothetical protein [Acidihalobacter aeolianus]
MRISQHHLERLPTARLHQLLQACAFNPSRRANRWNEGLGISILPHFSLCGGAVTCPGTADFVCMQTLVYGPFQSTPRRRSIASPVPERAHDLRNEMIGDEVAVENPVAFEIGGQHRPMESRTLRPGSVFPHAFDVCGFPFS